MQQNRAKNVNIEHKFELMSIKMNNINQFLKARWPPDLYNTDNSLKLIADFQDVVFEINQ